MRSRAPGVVARPLELSGPLVVVLMATLAACGDNPADVENSAATGCAASQGIAVGQAVSGQLVAGDCQENGTFGDRWTLTLATQRSVRIELNSTAFDAFLELRDNVGTVLAANDDAVGLNSRISRTLPAGSYVIFARSLGPGQTGGYQLNVREAPDCTPVGMVSLGQTVTGALASTDCMTDWDAPSDNWSLGLAAPARVRIELQSTAFDEVVIVRDPNGMIVTGADWRHPAGHALLDVQLPVGTWTIGATAPSATSGSYQLTVDVTPPCTPGTDVVFGQTIAGQITASDCSLFEYLPADSFRVVVDEETQLGIHLKSTDFSPLLFLRDQGGDNVAFGSDPINDGNAHINILLPSGAYALFAAGQPPIGSYSLTVEVIQCDEPSPIAFGLTVNGVLDASDCARSGGAYQESWELVLASDTTARIDLTTNAFDAYLLLKDTAGTVIATDDDSGEGLNSRIQMRLSAGTYEIVASSYSQGYMGAYQLAVNVPPPPSLIAPPYGGESAKPTRIERSEPLREDWRWSSSILLEPGGRSKR